MQDTCRSSGLPTRPYSHDAPEVVQKAELAEVPPVHQYPVAVAAHASHVEVAATHCVDDELPTGDVVPAAHGVHEVRVDDPEPYVFAGQRWQL